MKITQQAAGDLRAASRRVREAEAAYSDAVLLQVETLRRIHIDEPWVTVGQLAQLTGQPSVFIRMAVEGVVQTSIVTTPTA